MAMMSSALSASRDFSTSFSRSLGTRSAEGFGVERFGAARLRTAGFFWVMLQSPLRGHRPAAAIG
jgi:hypothetical protein